MAYSKAEDVLSMIKTDMLRSLMGDDCRLDGEKLREAARPYAQAAVEDADSEIDGYLAKRYRVPLCKIPAMVTKLSKDIAVYNMVSRRGIDESSRDKNILNRYNAAILYLTNLAKGIVELEGQGSGSAGTDPDTHGNMGFSVQSNERIFTRKALKGW